MAPMMGASYAISKVRTGKAKAFTRWMKDYTLLVLIQSVHALIYTCFVTVVLQLTNESIAGIVLALIVMNFMLKASDIFTNIFSMVGDKDGGSRSLGTILGSDPKSEIYEKLFIAKHAATSMIAGTAGVAMNFGKDLKSSMTTKMDRKKKIQAQAIGVGNLGKKALGSSWGELKNIDAATGQYVLSKKNAKKKGEVLQTLSEDLERETKLSNNAKKQERKKYTSELRSTYNNKFMNALKLTTALPLAGAGWSDLAAINFVSGATGSLTNSIKKRNLKNKKSIKKLRFTRPLSTVGKIASAPLLAGAENIKDSIKDAGKTGEKIQNSYESRMAQIGQAKEAESRIIDLYTKGRRDKEQEYRSINGTGTDDKVVKAIAKTSFDESYRRTVDNVFEVSDIVDERVDREKHWQSYKDNLGIDDKTIGKNSIEIVKETIRHKARNNISDKLRYKYQKENNYHMEETTERKIKEETEERLSKFMQDLDKEIDKNTVKDEKLANDPTVVKDDRFDFSETINADTLKSTIEDIMKKHDVDKRAEDGMDELKEEMERLQRIDRNYANSKDNKSHTYLYKIGTDIRPANESKTNLKNVLSSLTFRNIDINGGRR